MICVTGATGTVGRELVRQLQQRHARFFIMARDPVAAHASLGGGIDARQGDFSDIEGMTALFRGVTRLFLLCAPGPAMADLESNAVAAAKAAGVQHVVKVSAPGAAPLSPSGLLRMHGRVEQEIEQSGMTWTHLRPNGFMQNLWGPTQGIRPDASFRLSVGDATVPFIDAADIAAVAAVVLTEQGHEGQVYNLTGAEAPTYHDVAHLFAEALGTEVTYHPLTRDAARAQFIAEGLPPGLVEELTGYFDMMANGHAGNPTTAVRDVTGQEPVRLRDFIARNIGKFKSIVKDEAPMTADFIRELQAERAIRKVTQAYLSASDRFDVDAVLATMTEDVVWDGGAALGRHQGKAAIAGLVGFVGGITRFTAHLVTNEVINVDGDKATGCWWMMVPSTVEVDGEKVAKWLFAYSRTCFVKQAGHWLISEIKLEPRAHGPHLAGWA